MVKLVPVFILNEWDYVIAILSTAINKHALLIFNWILFSIWNMNFMLFQSSSMNNKHDITWKNLLGTKGKRRGMVELNWSLWFFGWFTTLTENVLYHLNWNSWELTVYKTEEFHSWVQSFTCTHNVHEGHFVFLRFSLNLSFPRWDDCTTSLMIVKKKKQELGVWISLDICKSAQPQTYT